METKKETTHIKIPSFLMKSSLNDAERTMKGEKKNPHIRKWIKIVISVAMGIILGALFLSHFFGINIFKNFWIAAILLAPCAFLGIVTGMRIEDKKREKHRFIVSFLITLLTNFIVIVYAVSLYCGMCLVDSISNPEKTISEDFVKNDMDVLCQMKPEIWKGLGLNERVAFCQYIADNEVVLRGLPYQLEVVTAQDLPEILAGKYQHKVHRIVINEEYLGEAESADAIRVTTHEFYHAMQYAQIEALHTMSNKYKDLGIFDLIKVYESEFQNYIPTGSDGYAEQMCEIESDKYAQSAVDYYYTMIYPK